MKRRQFGPPPWTVALIERAAPANVRAACVGDFLERFDRRSDRVGRAAAIRWCRRQAVLLTVGVLWDRLESSIEARRRGATSLFVGIGQDLRLALRQLWKRPGFTVPAVIALALGIGANAVVFSFVDAVLLRPLPYTEPDRLVMLWDLPPDRHRFRGSRPIAYRHYQSWREQTELFEAIGAYETARPAVMGDELTERVSGLIVSAGLFEMLGRGVLLGRTFQPADDVYGAPATVMISHHWWQTRLAGDPAAIGTTLRIDGVETEIIGVMPPDFWFYDPYAVIRSAGASYPQPDIWMPLHRRDWAADWADYPALRVMGRLADGVALSAAAETVAALRAGMRTNDEDEGWSAELVPVSELALANVRPRLLVLWGAVAVVLLLASLNVTGLVLARARSRSAELSVRAALGAGRWRLARTMLAESLTVAVIGGGIGLAGAVATLDAAVALAPRELPLLDRVGIDARVAFVAMALAVASGVAGGLVPALRRNAAGLGQTIGRGRVTGIAHSDTRLRSVLVAVEVALSLTLLIGAMLLLKVFMGFNRVDPGFEASSAITFQQTLAIPAGAAARYSFHDQLLEDLRGLPGAEAVGASTHLPFTEWDMDQHVVIGEAASVQAPGGKVGFRWISDDFFAATGIPVRRGRPIAADDILGSEAVAVVDELFVERYLDGQEPIGTTLHWLKWDGEPTGKSYRLVGVVGNVKHAALFENQRPTVYVANRQEPKIFLSFVVKTRAGSESLVPQIRDAAHRIDPTQPLESIASWADLVSASIAEERFYSWLLGLFGSAALLLTAIGVYGTVAYSVRLQMHEMGVRKALGASANTLLRLVVGRGMTPVLVGVLAGLAAASLATRSLDAWLHGMPRLDPASFATATIVFVLVALVATLLPARRAAAVSAMRILRDG